MFPPLLKWHLTLPLFSTISVVSSISSTLVIFVVVVVVVAVVGPLAQDLVQESVVHIHLVILLLLPLFSLLGLVSLANMIIFFSLEAKYCPISVRKFSFFAHILRRVLLGQSSPTPQQPDQPQCLYTLRHQCFHDNLMYVAMFPTNSQFQRTKVYLFSRSFLLVDGIILSSIWILLLLPLPPLLLLLLRLKTIANKLAES
jgi:hypothetical protein